VLQEIGAGLADQAVGGWLAGHRHSVGSAEEPADPS
jgi:hypothetical protein